VIEEKTLPKKNRKPPPEKTRKKKGRSMPAPFSRTVAAVGGLSLKKNKGETMGGGNISRKILKQRRGRFSLFNVERKK